MEKSMARNPNMLRALIGLSVTLILVLSYAVYSTSLKSEYYIYHTSNQVLEITPILESSGEDGNISWSATTDGALSWANFSIFGAPEGALLEVTSGGQKWWSDEILGTSEGEQFNCMEPNKNFTLINHCDEAFTHSASVDHEGIASIFGIVDDELPIDGVGSLRAENLSTAELQAAELVDGLRTNMTWLITLTSEGNLSSDMPIELTMIVVEHELVSVQQFELNPFVETVWSLTALLGCFAMALILPLGFYYASILKERRQERIRVDVTDAEE
tara:strand:- start:18 stop:836 length:819 start_codon:yes stop_codon:yes gene_type:complete